VNLKILLLVALQTFTTQSSTCPGVLTSVNEYEAHLPAAVHFVSHRLAENKQNALFKSDERNITIFLLITK
jgi:hypothetical protein